MTPVDLDYKSKQKSTAEEEGQSLSYRLDNIAACRIAKKLY